ncbi:nucleotide exchange factor GrpE, partial [Flavobacteriaceae bacterium]|nr:nucleotide exchange factor GrpE [Flavobacteriaceae bacterium]
MAKKENKVSTKKATQNKQTSKTSKTTKTTKTTKTEVKVAQQLKEVKESLEKEKDKYLRLFAEFENFKKRTAKERIELFKTANQEVISAMIPVLDDFKNIVFGKIFTDHMFYCNYRDGKWQTPEITPYKPLTLDPSSSVLHYGQAVFEGMKAFKDNNGLLWLFRPEENFKRINLSAKRLQIPEFPESFFFKGLKSLLKLDQDWVKPGTENSLYIRPFVFASQPSVQASASMEYIFMIICAPVKSYYTGGKINVLIAEEYSRAASG